jgi:hypothetical protein
MSFTCEECGKDLKSQQSLDYHKLHDACKVLAYTCKYCKRGFTNESNMYRHVRETCKTKKEDDNEKKGILERLIKLEEEMIKTKNESKKYQEDNKKCREDNKKLQKEVESMKKIINNTQGKTNTTNTNNTTNNINEVNLHVGDVNNVANIILVGYGQEDISKIDKNDLIKALQNGFNSTVKLTEAIHFNPKYPEYQNVYISNMKDKYAMTYDGKDWNLTIKEDLINKIYDDKKNYIEENLDDFIASLSTSRKNALDRWLVLADEDKRVSKIKDDIKLLLYNKRGMVEEKQKKIVKESKNRKKTIKHVEGST